jgi:2,3-bisphosphoglycerate-independent phosphoglycerate mutase
VVYNKDNIHKTLGGFRKRVKQIRIAETKYPHVTFFFSGGRGTFVGENRYFKNSPK